MILFLPDSLHQLLSEYSIVSPIRTNSEGRFLSADVSARHLTPRSRRHAHPSQDVSPEEGAPEDAFTTPDTGWMDTPTDEEFPPTGSSQPNRMTESGKGQDDMENGVELFYNVTVFGQELHLRLRPNRRLVAPSATMEWWEESGQKHRQRIEDAGCFYRGEVSDMENTSVAISNCDGLVGVVMVQTFDKYLIFDCQIVLLELKMDVRGKFSSDQTVHKHPLELAIQFTEGPSRPHVNY